ncbi:MAG: 3-oxo-tetronate kinase [Thiolinea sp.]
MNKQPVIGVIADDFTGATDIAAMLVRGGMQVVQTIGIPSADLLANIDADAIVVALKSRSIPAQEAIAQSLAAWDALAATGVRQCYFKYCSTFDSTPEGNIGPVTEALADALGVTTVAHVPALPVNGRSVYQGHLFVFDKLLNESGMEKHPLNPMSDANLVRWLKQQSQGDVGLIAQADVAQGAEAIQARMNELSQAGIGQVIGDAVSEQDLAHWGRALVDAPLVAGGSGLATPLAREHAALGHYEVAPQGALVAKPGKRPALMLAGSCSVATLGQIARFKADGGMTLRLDPREIAANPHCVQQAIGWVRQNLLAGSVLVYASGTAEQVQAAQAELGAERAGQLAEAALSQIARELMPADGGGRLIAAGGETSGAVVSALGISALRIGPEIDPGVPWTQALDNNGNVLGWLALKSGNFGAEDFFAKATQILDDAGKQ